MGAVLEMTLEIDGIQGAGVFGYQSGPPLSFVCRAVRGREAISEPFRYDIVFVADPEVAAKLSATQVLGKRARLSITAPTQYNNIVVGGVILEFRMDEILDTPKQVPCSIVLGPRLALMDCNQKSEIIINTEAGTKEFFENRALPSPQLTTLVRSTTAGQMTWATDIVVKDSVNKVCPIAKNISRYNETDLAFFSRIAEGHGVFYFFSGTRGDGNTSVPLVDVLWVGGNNDDFVPYSTQSQVYKTKDASGSELLTPCVFSFSRLRQLHTGSVGVRGYNADESQTPLLSESVTTSAGFGEKIQYGEAFTSTEEATLSEIRAQEVAWQSMLFEGESTLVGLRAGRVLKLGDASNTAEYIIVSVESRAATSNVFDTNLGLSADEPYRNRFLAIPKSTAFRPVRRTPRPVMAGVFNGVVAGSGKRANLDADGAYLVSMQFDEGARRDSMSTPRTNILPVRKAEPYGSSNPEGVRSGMHFPLVPGTEVMVSYVDGHPDRPVILGAAANSENKDPVTSASPTASRLRTAAGTLLEMEDGAGVDDTTKPRFLRLDVPSKVTPETISGTYFRMGMQPAKEVTDSKKSIATGLAYKASTIDVKSPEAGTHGGMKNTNNGKKQQYNVAEVSTSAPMYGSGKGLQFYAEDDFDVNVLGAGLMKFAKGLTTEVTSGSSFHTVASGNYTLNAQGIAVTAEQGGDRKNITITTAGTLKKTAAQKVTKISYGGLAKAVVGESFTRMEGAELTLKASFAATLQLSAAITMTSPFATSATLGLKFDFMYGASVKMAFLYGDYKFASQDGKILFGSDFKFAERDTKILSGEDYKICLSDVKLNTTDAKTAALKMSKSELTTISGAVGAYTKAIRNESNDLTTQVVKVHSLL